MKTQLEIEQLRTCAIVRPYDTCGTCGWHPKAWTVGIYDRRRGIIGSFLTVNPNWTADELEA